jgi:tryptophanyl-tRNA synthetase
VCSVFDYHKIFNVGEVPQIEKDCIAASLGCVDCKKNLAEKINQVLDPFRERRAQYEREPKRVREIIAEGNLTAQTEAEATMKEVREAMHLPG